MTVRHTFNPSTWDREGGKFPVRQRPAWSKKGDPGQFPVRQRPAWSTEGDPEQPGIYRETQSQRTKQHNNNQKRMCKIQKVLSEPGSHCCHALEEQRSQLNWRKYTMTPGGSEHSQNSENFSPKIGTVHCLLEIVNFFKDLKTKYFDKYKTFYGKSVSSFCSAAR